MRRHRVSGWQAWAVAGLLVAGGTVQAQEETAASERVYVTDALEVTLREGAGTRHEIAQMVRSGTALELLEEDGRWTRVRTEDGTEGWILSRYLEDEPVGRFRIDRLEQHLSTLSGENTSLFLEIRRLRQSLDEAGQRIEGLREESDLLSDRLSQASEGLRMQEDNERLRERIARQQEEIRELREHAMQLADRDRKEWFVIGAGVLLMGLVAGMVAGSLTGRRRKDRWGNI